MGFLLDTHLLLWFLYRPSRLPRGVMDLLAPARTRAYFSTASFIEMAIKQKTGKLEFAIDLPAMRRSLLQNRMQELHVVTGHTFVLSELPLLHRDPFDRVLIAQAITENLTLLTVDKILTDYSPNVRYVG
jgi:PIN domain nuclease of toxin-antitoxin system